MQRSASSKRVLQGVAEVDLEEVLCALDRVPLRHLDLGRREILELLVVALLLLEELLLQVADVVEVLGRPVLLGLEALLAGDQLLEVDLVGVEVGAVDAGELDLAVDSDAAGAAHAGAVDHDRVERHHGLDLVGPGRLGAGLHHRQRADGDDEVGLVVLQHVLQRLGDEAGAAVGTVVGADDQVIGILGELVFPEAQVLVAEADDAGGAVADFLEPAKLRIDRRHAEAATDEDDMAELLDVLGQAERADEIAEGVTLLVVVAHFPGRLAQRLDHHGDRALVAIEIGDRERNALAALVEADHDEMTGLSRPGDVGAFHFPEEGGVGKLLAAENRVHGLDVSSLGGFWLPGRAAIPIVRFVVGQFLGNPPPSPAKKESQPTGATRFSCGVRAGLDSARGTVRPLLPGSPHGRNCRSNNRRGVDTDFAVQRPAIQEFPQVEW